MKSNNIKKTLKNTLVVGLVGITGLTASCDSPQPKTAEAEPISTPYFAIFPVYSENPFCLLNGDFDNDGDLDLIVGSQIEEKSWNEVANSKGALYFYENDGKGNFTLKPKQNDAIYNLNPLK